MRVPIKNSTAVLLILFLVVIPTQAQNHTNNTVCHHNISHSIPTNETSLDHSDTKSQTNSSLTSMTSITDNLSLPKNSSDINLSLNLPEHKNKTGQNTSQNRSISASDCTFSVSSDRIIYEKGQKVTIAHNISDCSDDFSIEYWIEDLFGKIAKRAYTTKNTDKKSWTAETKKDVDVFTIRSVMTQDPESNNSKEHASEKIIIVISEESDQDGTNEQDPQDDLEEEEKEPFIDIIRIKHKKDGHAMFGELIKVRALIGRGDSAKYSIKAWIEDDDEKRITDKHTINLKEKNVEVEIEISMLIEPDCEKEQDQGTYYLILKGLGLTETEKIEIEGWKDDLCQEIEPECPQCEQCPAPIESGPKNEKEVCDCSSKRKQEENLIKSFYTLQKKTSDKIKLFSNFNFISNSSIEATILSIRNITKVPFKEEKQTSLLPLHKNKNDFILILKNNRTILDYSEITFFNNITDDKTEEQIHVSRQDSAEEDQQKKAGNTGSKKIAQHDSLKTITSAEIASPIYESTQEKTKKFSFIGLGIVLLLLSYIGAKRFLSPAIRKYIRKSAADSE